MKKTLLLAGVACLFASQANAEGYFFKPYLGLDYVHSWISETDLGNDANSEKIKLKEDNMSAGQIALGVKFHPNFAFEAFYAQSDKIESTNTWLSIDADGVSETTAKISEKYSVIGADFIGSVPVMDGLEFLGSLGAGHYRIKNSVTGAYTYDRVYFDTYSNSESSNKWGVRVGVGAQYYLTDYLALRGMVRMSRIDSNGSLTDLTAGVRVYF